MLIPIVVMGTLIWLITQCVSDKSREKWQQRFEPWAPVVAEFRRDVRAIRRHARDWPRRLRDRQTFRRLRRTYDEY